MRGVRRHVAALVVAVQRQVQAQQVDEALVVGLAEHGRVVVRPVLGQVDGAGQRPAAVVRVLVDLGGDGRQLREQLDRVVEDGLPVVGLGQAALLVQLGELGVVVEGRDGNGDCRVSAGTGGGGGGGGRAGLHWVMGCRVVGRLSISVSTNSGSAAFSASVRLNTRTCSVLGTWPVSSSQNMPSGSISSPVNPLGRMSWHSRMVLPWKRMPSLASSTEPSQSMAFRPLRKRQQPWRRRTDMDDGPHAANKVLDLDLADHLAAVLQLELLELLALERDDLLERLLEVLLAGGREPSPGGIGEGGGTELDNNISLRFENPRNHTTHRRRLESAAAPHAGSRSHNVRI